jgi:hypothetical protein
VTGRDRDAPRQPRAGGEGVRAAPRPTAHGEPIQPELVGNRGDVADAVDHTAPGVPRRASIPRPVISDHAQPRFGDAVAVRVQPTEAGARGAVEHKDGSSRAIADLFVAEPASVASDHFRATDRAFRAAHRALRMRAALYRLRPDRDAATNRA